MSTFLLIFIITIAIQMVFIVGLGWKILSADQPKTSAQQPGVSIIIAARDEAPHLPKLIEVLSSQDYPVFEVIIINDRSTDESLNILEGLKAKYSFLKPIHVETLPLGWTGKKYALTQGVKNAEHSLLLFTDADCQPISNLWVSSMVTGLTDSKDLVLGYSPYQKQRGWLNKFIQFETLFVALQYLGFSLWGKPYMGVGRNLLIRKEKYDLNFLESIKNLEGGDDDLMVAHIAKSNNSAVVIQPNSFTLSQPEQSIKTYLKQKTRHLSAGKYYHQKDQTLLAFFTLSCVVGWGLFFALILMIPESSALWWAFGIRTAINYFILKKLGRKLNTEIEIWALPFLDLCYCFYYPLVAIRALATKQVEWK